MASKKLPVLPSNLLQVAYDDMNKSIAAGMTINMNNWIYKYEQHCSVCLAGAVMLHTLKVVAENNASRRYPYAPNEILGEPDCNRNLQQLLALNNFRVGYYDEFLHDLAVVSKKLGKYTSEEILDLALELDQELREEELATSLDFEGIVSEPRLKELNAIILYAIEFFRRVGL